jgi:hypothetical protein
MENKRKDNRAAISSNAEIMAGGASHACRIQDISTGGAKLRTHLPIEPGQTAVLKIGNFGQFNVTVAWLQGAEMGIKFDHDPMGMATVIMGLASYG